MVGGGFDSSEMHNHVKRRSKEKRYWGIMLVSRIMIFGVSEGSFIAKGLCL
jgi:hypothetical protein